MPLDLRECDYLPLSACEFQHWGERSGPPFDMIRPLGPDAAERVWRNTVAMAAATWTAGPGGALLDLAADDDWDEGVVRDWLLAHVPDRDLDLIVCFQPRIAVCLPWGTLCDHWLTVLWTGACAFPASGEWVLVHDGDRFALGFRPTDS